MNKKSRIEQIIKFSNKIIIFSMLLYLIIGSYAVQKAVEVSPECYIYTYTYMEHSDPPPKCYIKTSSLIKNYNYGVGVVGVVLIGYLFYIFKKDKNHPIVKHTHTIIKSMEKAQNEEK